MPDFPKKPKGVDAFEVFAVSEEENALMWSDNCIKTRESSEEQGFGIRALKAGRLGFAFCQSGRGIPAAIGHAAAASRFSPKSPFSFRSSCAPRRIDIYDWRVADADASDLRGMLGQVRDAAGKGAGQCRVSLSAGEGQVSIENTEGLSMAYESTEISVFAESMAGDGYGMSFYSSPRLPPDFHSIGKRASELALAMRRPKKMEPGEYTVVLDTECLSSVMEVLLPSFSGDWKRRKTSLLASSLGRHVFSEKLSIWEDGTETSAGSPRPFDDEGVPSERRPLVEKGVVRGFLYDREAAALEGVKEEGCCSRSDYSLPPAIGRSNLAIGTGGYADFESDLREFILVHSAHGSHTSNQTTGDFGLEVSTAFHVKNGKKSPVRGFMLSGNVFNLFKSIIGMEKRAEAFGDMLAPRIAFRGVRVVS